MEGDFRYGCKVNGVMEDRVVILGTERCRVIMGEG